MRKSERYEKKILKLSKRLFDPSLDPAEKAVLKQRFHELNKKKNIAIQKELERELARESGGLFHKIREAPGSLGEKIRDDREDRKQRMFDAIMEVGNDALEEQVKKALARPETLPEFIRAHHQDLCSLLNSQDISQLGYYIDLNLEKDFRLVIGPDLSLSLKDALRSLFTVHRTAVDRTIADLLQERSKSLWDMAAHIGPERVMELVRLEAARVEGEKKPGTMLVVLCRVIQQKMNDPGHPQSFDEVYDEVSELFYRALKSELREQEVWDKKGYVLDLKLEDEGIDDVVKSVKERVLAKMNSDPYLD